MREKTIDRPQEDYSIPPPLDSWVQEELTKTFGLNRFNEPNVKIVWGGNERERKSDGTWGLKYWIPGKTKTVMAPTLVNSIWAVREKVVEVGTPRWIAERFTDPSRLSPVEREAHPRGRYTFYYEVEDLQGNYRSPGRDTIEHLQVCINTQAERDRETDRELQKQIDEDNAPVGRALTTDYITPEVYREI
jgi:hypothetical protein